MGNKTPKIAPFLWNFVSLPEEDRVTAIGNMQKLVKIARVVRKISSRTNKQTHGQTHYCLLMKLEHGYG